MMRSRRHGGADRERGAVLLEFVVITPLVVLLAMGLIEFGYAFRSHNIETQAAANAVRVLSAAGYDGNADYLTLESLAAGLANLPDGTEVVRVVLFDPEGPAWADGTCRTMMIPPTGNTGVGNQCNVYAGWVLGALDPTEFTQLGHPTCSPGVADVNFCPLRRDADPDGGGTMRLGVYVEIRHQMLTGLFPPGELTMTEDVEMCAEPAPIGATPIVSNLGDATGDCDGTF